MALGEPVVPQSSFKVTFIASLNASTHASFSGACKLHDVIQYCGLITAGAMLITEKRTSITYGTMPSRNILT